MGLWFCAQESLCKQEVGKRRVMLLGSPWPGGSSYRCAPGHAVLLGSGPETAGSAQENCVEGAVIAFGHSSFLSTSHCLASTDHC